MTETQNTTATKDCCPACHRATELTQQPGTTPFNKPFVGRPLGKLMDGDTIRSVGSEHPHHLGAITRESNRLMVQWDDRNSPEELTGAIALCVLRKDELPSTPGHGLMPINGQLVEMTPSHG